MRTLITSEVKIVPLVKMVNFKLFFPKFVESKILVKTRRIRKSDYYKFNMENEFVKNIIKISWMLVKKDLFREVEVKV